MYSEFSPPVGTVVSRSLPPQQSIEFGDDVDLTAEWTIDPGIDVTATWTFNGIRYPYREFPFSETEDGRLFVDTTKLEEVSPGNGGSKVGRIVSKI